MIRPVKDSSPSDEVFCADVLTFPLVIIKEVVCSDLFTISGYIQVVQCASLPSV